MPDCARPAFVEIFELLLIKREVRMGAACGVAAARMTIAVLGLLVSSYPKP